MPKRSGRTSTGGSRPRVRRVPTGDRPAPHEPASPVVALLRGIWEKRRALTEGETTMVQSFLQHVQRRPLTDRQLEVTKRIGKSLGIGFDDPSYDTPAPAKPPGAIGVERWGVLPAKPPGR